MCEYAPGKTICLIIINHSLWNARSLLEVYLYVCLRLRHREPQSNTGAKKKLAGTGTPMLAERE